MDRPADFDSYWSNVLRQARTHPLEPALTPVASRSTSSVEAFDVHYTSLDGLRIAGWYCRPRAPRTASPSPGLVITPGYIGEPMFPKLWAGLGYATLSVAPRGKLRSDQHFNPGFPGLLVHDIIDRDSYSYRALYTDACRAVEFLHQRDEVDPGRIGVMGSSQGGILSVVSAALQPDWISCCVAGSPFMCGIVDALRLTHSYPYEEISEYLWCHPDYRDAVACNLEYFDGLNFAPLVRCPTLIYIGERDDVCPPECSLALHRKLTCDAELLVSEGCGHDGGAPWVAGHIRTFLARWLGTGPGKAGPSGVNRAP